MGIAALNPPCVPLLVYNPDRDGGAFTDTLSL
jgi:hypothetical protein